MTFHEGSHGEVEVGIIAEDFCAIDTDDLRFTIVSKRAISRDHALVLDPKNVTYQPITTRHREGAALERARRASDTSPRESLRTISLWRQARSDPVRRRGL